jgi:tetratricopeptide (TPR) repeat protein
MSPLASEGPGPSSRSRTGRRLVLASAALLVVGAAWWLIARRGGAEPELRCDLFVGAEGDVRGLVAKIPAAGTLPPLKIDYPLARSVFPPEIVAPAFLFHDADNSTDAWLVDVSFETTPHHVYALVDGKRPKPEIDRECVTESNVYCETPYAACAKGWTPDERTWKLMKRYSTERDATVTILGVKEKALVSRGTVKLRTSVDPVGAMIFYRDVPLMPAVTEAGIIQPIAQSAMPMIKWRLRDLSKPSASVAMEYIPTCANCHSFSRDGKTLAMDIDGPSGDKGAHVVVPVTRHTFVGQENVFSWNQYPSGQPGLPSYGLFPQVSPDGRHVIATILETLYVRNHRDYAFLQSFYPTRGVLAFFDRGTHEIRLLSGADDSKYVQTNPAWSPDGKTIVFLRAPASDPDPNAPPAREAGDSLEAQVRFDLCTVPFNGGKGGAARPLPGASNNGASNSFPRFSPDGKWIVFVQSHNAMLMRPDSRLYIMPAEGGTPRLMSCNTSRMNSWHSWSPNSRWLVFSSKCNTPYTQLFLTHVDEDGRDTPAVLVPDSTVSNRAANLPELVSLLPGELIDITTPAVEYRRLMDRAEALVKQGRHEEALGLLRESIEMKSDYAPTHSSIGSVLARLGKADEAIAELNKALEINPNYYFAHANFAILLSRMGRHEQAIEHCRKVLETNPDFLAIHLDWGSALYALGRGDEAVEHFRKIAEADPQNVPALLSLGSVYLQMKKPEVAADYLDRAVRANPKSLPALLNLGLAMRRLGRYDEAVARFRQALDIDPNFFPATYEWGNALAGQGKGAEAAKRFRRTIEINPQYPDARDALARILATDPDAKVRDGREALAQATAACRQTRYSVPEFMDTLAAACAESGKFDEARENAQKALDLATSQRKSDLAAGIRAHLELFEKNQPLRGEK